jgi:predicted aldo/keto reductase-like oxidoreductase
MALGMRPLGKTGREVGILGLGGEGVLRTYGYEPEARELIARALDMGITYMESARAYLGSESYYGKALGERRSEVFLASKSHAREAKEAREHLETTLGSMRTDYLDLWQLHDMRSMEEVDRVLAPGGALEAFAEARRQGLVRFVGVTGHHDPAVVLACLKGFDFDTVLIPVNPAEHAYRSFLADVLPFARRSNVGVVGMKVYLRGLVSGLPWFESMEPFMRYALSQPVSTVVVGCDDTAQLVENVRFAERFEPMTDEEASSFEQEVGSYARELMYYKPQGTP